MPAEPLLLGVDVGTTAAKGGVFDREGAPLALAEAGYAIDRPEPGWVEQDPETWWQALAAVVRDLGEQVDLDRVAGVGICSQVNTHTFVDAHGLAIAPAVVWQDQRCAEVAAELDARLTPEVREEFWGGPFAIDASFLISRAAWFSRHRPTDWKRVRWILSPKDFLNRRLTGSVATDPISPIGLVGPDGAYIQGALELVPGAWSRMPPLRSADSVLGHASGLGLPSSAVVVVGTMDAWANLYGSGVTDAGHAMEVAGTSEIIGVLSAECRPTPGVVSFHPVDGLYLHAGPTQSGGESLRWFAEANGLELSEVLEEAEGAPAGSDGLLFAPHLAGERAPLWDSDARGIFFGIGAGHSRVHFARATLEGVAFSARHLLEAIEEAAGLRAEALRASGGGARSDLWCQIKADVCGCEIRRLRVVQSGALGAALLAGKGAGVFEDLREAAARAVHVEATFRPRATEAAVYEDLYGIYRGLYPALKPSFQQLSVHRAATALTEKGVDSDRVRSDRRARAR